MVVVAALTAPYNVCILDIGDTSPAGSGNGSAACDGRSRELVTDGAANVKRANFFVDDRQLEALKHVATMERVSIAELVREGIDRVIRDRIKNPRNERAQLKADLDAFLRKYAGKGRKRTDEEIDDIVTEARRGKRVPT